MANRNSIDGRRAAAAALIVLAAAAPAHGYIDPGTGSSLLSSVGVLLGIVGSAIAVGFYQMRHWIGMFWSRLSAGRSAKPDAAATPEE